MGNLSEVTYDVLTKEVPVYLLVGNLLEVPLDVLTPEVPVFFPGKKF